MYRAFWECDASLAESILDHHRGGDVLALMRN